MELALGAGGRDVEEAALLVARRGSVGPSYRHEAALEAGEEHHRPLEPLRRVERGERDAVAAVLRVLALHRRGEPGEERGDGRAVVGRRMLVGEADERLEA